MFSSRGHRSGRQTDHYQRPVVEGGRLRSVAIELPERLVSRAIRSEPARPGRLGSRSSSAHSELRLGDQRRVGLVVALDDLGHLGVTQVEGALAGRSDRAVRTTAELAGPEVGANR